MVLIGVMVAAMLVAGGVMAVLLSRTPASPGAGATPTASASPPPVSGPASAARLARGRWSEIRRAPIPPRPGASAVWTGSELIVWGGGGGAPLADGAAFNPATDRWRTLPRSPLAARSGQSVVWDGTEMLVWGGTGVLSQLADGAAFNPSSGTWRLLPAAPISGRSQALAVWTGSAMVLVGGVAAATEPPGIVDSLHDGAAYDPAANRWTAVPAPAVAAGRTLLWSSSVWAGDRLIGFASWALTGCTPHCAAGQYGSEVYTADAHGSAWTLLPPAAGALDGVEESLWTGTSVLAHGGRWCGGCVGNLTAPSLAGYDPARRAWTALPPDPIAWGQPVLTWTGAALLSFDEGGTATEGGTGGGTPINPGDTTAWDTASGWLRLPSIAPGCGDGADIPPPVWTGRQVLMYCFATGPNGSDGLAFTPGG